MEQQDKLMALSPLDGRYGVKLNALRPIFSEYGLIHRRVAVEVAWLEELCATPTVKEARDLTEAEVVILESLVTEFGVEDARKIKEFERTTNHDVKAVEYYLRERLSRTSLADLVEFVHFACTSEDINNLAHALMLRDGLRVLREAQGCLAETLITLAQENRDTPMLARTHGQTASPTTLGKELAVFAARFRRQALQMDSVALMGKLNGATGNFNAHMAAYPAVDWEALADRVIKGRLGLERNVLTTQIEPHDFIAELFDAMARWNTVLLDLNRDIWSYISVGYLGQKTLEGEVGSSTMPHKINPIDFENSEGNLGLANAVLGHMARKLSVSRLQRDLSDSTVLRNMGVGFGYTLIAVLSTLKGLGKITVNHIRLEEDLAGAWEVLAEPVQTVLRKLGQENPYDQLKVVTRGKRVDAEAMRRFIEGLDLPLEERERLLTMTPATYTGLAGKLVEHVLSG